MHKLAPLLLVVAVSLHAQNAPHTVVATALPVMTFDELAARTPFPPTASHVHAREADFSSPGRVETRPTSTAAPALTPPPLGLQFLDESDPSHTYPTDATGAVSKSLVVGANDKSIWIHDRATGNSIAWAYLNSFWAIPGTFAPRLAYDPQFDRFVMVSLRDDGPPNYLNAKLLVAMSDSNDPRGTWRRFVIPLDASNQLNGDATRLALTRDNILITANLYQNANGAFLGAQVFSVSRQAAFSGPASLPLTAGNIIGIPDLIPVSVYDATDSSNWFITLNASAGFNIYDATSATLLSSNHIPVDTVSFCCGVGPQLGSSQPLDPGIPSIQYALIRNHKLWIVQPFTPSMNALSAVVAYNIDLTTSTTKSWVIQSTDTGYAFPSIAVNKYGAALVAYSAYGPNIYPSAAFTYIAPDGEWSAPAMLKSGSGPYTICRCGDYTTTVVDPTDDFTFWTTQVISVMPNPYPTWQTWWTAVRVPAGPQKHHAARH